MKFVFFGTSIFSVAILEKLISDFFIPELVITQPDKPAGRKQILTPPPVKDVCVHHEIPFLQPENLNKIEDKLRSLDIDLIITASYGKIIPQAILDIPKKGAINVHTSLLPLYRGASPIQTAILKGEEKTGITIMLMDAQMDHGDILYQKSVPITQTDTFTSLQSKLAHIGADTLPKIIPDYLKGKITPRAQNHEQATLAPMIEKSDAEIKWNQDCTIIDHQIRAYYDWPTAWTTLPDGKRIKIYKAHCRESDHPTSPGKIHIQRDIAGIETLDGLIAFDEVQVEGGKVMSAKEFISGYLRFHGKSVS